MPKLSFEEFPGFAEALAKASPTARKVSGGWIVTRDEASSFVREVGLLLEKAPASGHFVEIDGEKVPAGPARRPIETLGEISLGGLVFVLASVPIGSSGSRIEGRVLTAFGGCFTDFQKETLAPLAEAGFERLRLRLQHCGNEVIHDALALRTGDEDETRAALNAAFVSWKAAIESVEPPTVGAEDDGGALIDDELPEFEAWRAA